MKCSLFFKLADEENELTRVQSLGTDAKLNGTVSETSTGLGNAKGGDESAANTRAKSARTSAIGYSGPVPMVKTDFFSEFGSKMLNILTID